MGNRKRTAERTEVKPLPWLRVAVASTLILTASLLSCGGASVSGGGITGTGFTSGVITGLGSIVVTDVEFDLATATVTKEGLPAVESDLDLGMVVTIFGSINADGVTGTALTVNAENVLQGSVDSVDVGGGTFESLSQTILVDGATVFAGVTLPTLGIGDTVEVSGFVDADGNIRATRVEDRGGSGDSEISGIIENFDEMAETFTLGPLTIDFSSADIEGAPPGGLTDGLFVEVETDSPVVGGIFDANEVEVEDELGSAEGDAAEFEGFVTSVLSDTEFVLNHVQTVRINPETEFEGGASEGIEINVELSAKGVFDPEGTIVAERIQFED